MCNWHFFLRKEKKLFYFQKLISYINYQIKIGKKIYPPSKDIFNVFRYTTLNNIKVVIVGQDPYCYYNQANGLAFSVNYNISIPPSLNNIYQELKNEISDFIIPNHGYLKSWALQGILLLNSILTVESGKTYSHANLGWEIFTDKIISLLNTYHNNIIFLLWGVYAQKKEKIINRNKHFILKTSHPSPLSAYKGFFGCNHFIKTNNLLLHINKKPINWNIC